MVEIKFFVDGLVVDVKAGTELEVSFKQVAFRFLFLFKGTLGAATEGDNGAGEEVEGVDPVADFARKIKECSFLLLVLLRRRWADTVVKAHLGREV